MRALHSSAARPRIARSIGRARIETSHACRTWWSSYVSPDQLVGRGLKRIEEEIMSLTTEYRPINWSGAD